MDSPRCKESIVRRREHVQRCDGHRVSRFDRASSATSSVRLQRDRQLARARAWSSSSVERVRAAVRRAGVSAAFYAAFRPFHTICIATAIWVACDSGTVVGIPHLVGALRVRRSLRRAEEPRSIVIHRHDFARSLRAYVLAGPRDASCKRLTGAAIR